MPSFKQRLTLFSRDRQFLLRSALIIALTSILIGFAVSKLGKQLTKQNTLRNKLILYCPWLEDTPSNYSIIGLDPFKLTQLVNLSSEDGFKPENIAEAARAGLYQTALSLGIPQNTLTPKAEILFKNFVNSLQNEGNSSEESKLKLKQAAESESPQRFAGEFYADTLRAVGKKEEALNYFRREVSNYPQSIYAKSAIMRELLTLGKIQELKKWFSQKDFREAMDHKEFENVAVRLGEWPSIVKRTASEILTRVNYLWLTVTAFSAFIWFIILTNLGHIGEHRKPRAFLYGMGFVSGFVSTFVVLGLVLWQETTLNFKLNGEIVNDILYTICGIGLREELIKLLFFSPFLLPLLKRRSSMEALATAACVGLGFACSENLLYFGPGAEGGVFPRFLTANFFHASLTGITGLTLFYFVRWPKTRWEEFIRVFTLVVVAHGIYDALVGLVTQIAEPLGILAIIIFAITSNRYINLAKEIRASGTASISPLGIFVIGSSLLIGIAWILACYLNPISTVLQTVGQGAIEMGAMAFIFINQFRNE